MSASSTTSPKGETFVHYSERIPVRFCNCGRRMELFTNWKCDDAGRRYYRCGSYARPGCGNRVWYNPPSCERANRIISRFLKKLDGEPGSTSTSSTQSESTFNHRECKAKIKALKKTNVAQHAKAETLTRGCFGLLAFSVCLLIIIWILMRNNHYTNFSNNRRLPEL